MARTLTGAVKVSMETITAANNFNFFIKKETSLQSVSKAFICLSIACPQRGSYIYFAQNWIIRQNQSSKVTVILPMEHDSS